MSEIVANLDAAIADYRASNQGIDRSIVIFGREWALVSELTTSTADALARVAVLADNSEDDDGRQALSALSALGSVIPSVINEEERAAFQAAWDKHSIPLGALELIIEAVMSAFNPAPFSPDPATGQNDAGTPERSSESGNGHTPYGQKSSQQLPSAPTPSPAVPFTPGSWQPSTAPSREGTGAPS